METDPWGIREISGERRVKGGLQASSLNNWGVDNEFQIEHAVLEVASRHLGRSSQQAEHRQNYNKVPGERLAQIYTYKTNMMKSSFILQYSACFQVTISLLPLPFPFTPQILVHWD